MHSLMLKNTYTLVTTSRTTCSQSLLQHSPESIIRAARFSLCQNINRQPQYKHLHAGILLYARIRRPMVVPINYKLEYGSDEIPPLQSSQSAERLTMEQLKTAHELDQLADDVLASMYDGKQPRKKSLSDSNTLESADLKDIDAHSDQYAPLANSDVIQPQAEPHSQQVTEGKNKTFVDSTQFGKLGKLAETVFNSQSKHEQKQKASADPRHAAADALDKYIEQQIEMDIQPSSAKLDDIAQRRAAVMELYDLRHEHVQDGPNEDTSDTAKLEDAVKTTRKEDDWYVDVAHNIPEEYTQAAPTVPRWLRGVAVAHNRQEGIIESEDEIAMAMDGSVESSVLLSHVLKVIADERGFNLTVIDVRSKCDHTDYMVIVEGRSTKQIYSIADAVRRKVKSVAPVNGSMPDHLQIQGADSEDWMALDLGNVILNCFTPESRQFYDLDRLWVHMNAETISTDFVLKADEIRDIL
ncbi:hypothetical protein MT418_001213 [Batrachochytrium dendrobatidis]